MANIFLDLENSAIVGGAPIAAVTTTGTNASVDFSSCVGNYASCLQYVGTVSGTGGPTLTTKIQESTDGTTWTDITGAVFDAVTTTDNRQLISFRTLKQYLRGYNTVAGTTSPSFTVGNTFFGQRRTTPNSALGGGWTNEAGASI